MLLEEGQLDAVLVGGTEAPLTPLVYNACLESGMLSPTQHYRPFHHDADGMLLAEGAAMIVMEEESRARARGARIFADVMGVGFGASLTHSMRDCLSQADTSAGAVDYLILDARGSWADDAQEYAAIESVFGRDSTVRMSAPKSVYGNLIAASMGTDLATACLALERQAVPPTVGDFATLRIPPTGHHVVGACESATLSSVLVNGRDNYGHGMSILLGAPRQVAERGEGS